jgi:hypothetical protein
LMVDHDLVLVNEKPQQKLSPAREY